MKLIITTIISLAFTGYVLAGCEYDNQCKGDRVCNNGQCQLPDLTDFKKAAKPEDPSKFITLSLNVEQYGIRNWVLKNNHRTKEIGIRIKVSIPDVKGGFPRTYSVNEYSLGPGGKQIVVSDLNRVPLYQLTPNVAQAWWK